MAIPSGFCGKDLLTVEMGSIRVVLFDNKQDSRDDRSTSYSNRNRARRNLEEWDHKVFKAYMYWGSDRKMFCFMQITL